MKTFSTFNVTKLPCGLLLQTQQQQQFILNTIQLQEGYLNVVLEVEVLYIQISQKYVLNDGSRKKMVKAQEFGVVAGKLYARTLDFSI